MPYLAAPRVAIVVGRLVTRYARSMVHLAMSECRRIAAFAACAECGKQQRRDIIDTLARSLIERQGDPRVDSDQVTELLALIVGLKAAA
jgi:hypothetical protein